MSYDSLKEYIQLNNIDESTSSILDFAGKENVYCISSGGGEKVQISSLLNKRAIYVCKDSVTALEKYRQFKSYLEDKVCLFQPNDDLLLYRKSFQKSLVGERVKALYKFASNECQIMVTSAAALIQYWPKIDRIKDCVTKIKVNEDIDLYDFIDKLVSLGYQREEACEEKNTFAVNGDIIDVFLSDMESPIRISFFGDTIESIKVFDVSTFLSTTSMQEICIYPNNDLLYKKDEIQVGLERAKNYIKSMSIDAANRASQIISDICFSSSCNQQKQWLIPFMYEYSCSFANYLDGGDVVIIDEPSQVYATILNCYKENESRVKDMAKRGEVTLQHLKAYINEDDLLEQFKKIKSISFANIMASKNLFVPERIIRLSTKKVNNYLGRANILEEDIHRFINAAQMVVICQPTKQKAQALQKSMNNGGIPCRFVEKINEHKVGVYIVESDIIEGFIYPAKNLVVIGCEDISKKGQSSYSKHNGKNVFLSPQIGDYVVHETFGIGKCLGFKRLKVGGVEQDYLAIEYRDGAMLYLPSSQIDKISKYSGSEDIPKLASLNGNEFAKQKEKVKKKIKQLAFSLVELYAKRQSATGYKYPKDDYMQHSFEDAFEYELTLDQEKAVADIKEEMERGIVIDRLVCGDVGYGKTEVALRAIFKTIIAGKQAAILVPTTILAQQHYKTAMDRMKDFGIGIELVSRLKTASEINTSLQNIKEGKSQLIIATHRLLSKDVQFLDLGLLVLDEEQRFGVGHKEKLKLLNQNLNVITLSATPIPRTLNMSLIGVRDISVLETPPQNRLPVQTTVAELTDTLLEEAIKRELARGGQVFILYNDIENIQRFAEHVQSVVKEAKVVYAHGQMVKRELEKRIEKFYEKKSNVLVATTIIENGIDIPDANTLIVCNSDRLGLSQLYQLRGRVGRSNRLAYAFFTIPAGKVITSDATQRLNAILDCTELGSGFRIAMHDLEIRGAGSILGAEQHGHIEKVGYDMYCKLLQECVDEINGVEHIDVTCKMDVELNAFLDKKYIEDDNSRIKILRDIVEVSSYTDKEELKERIRGSFGAVPQSLENLINIGLARNLAEKLLIEHVVINKKGMGATFKDISFLKNEKLMNVISQNRDNVVLTNENNPRLVFNCKNKTNAEKLDMIIQFLQSAM